MSHWKDKLLKQQKVESIRHEKNVEKKPKSSIVRKVLLFSTLIMSMICIINVETLYSSAPSKITGLGESFYHELSSILVAITGKEDANDTIMMQYIVTFISFALLTLFWVSAINAERKGYNAIMEENIENIVQDAIEVIGSFKECNNKTHEKTI